MQHVVYKEWLPQVLGSDVMARHGLNPLSSGYTTYNASLDATILNEFAAAAFRFGHTLISGAFLRVGADGQEESFLLRDYFFYPFDFYEGALDRVTRGLIRQPLQSFDRYGTQDLTHYVFKPRNHTYGGDLFAADIQRGRDHGIRGYTDYVQFCGGPRINSFDDLHRAERMPRSDSDLYEKLYRNVKDIDFFSAGISEIPTSGALIGPTMSCIVAEMFRRLKYGDRFYYEHGHQAGSFTEEQLGRLRKTTMANIICENSDGIKEIQQNVFIPAGLENPMMNCSNLEDLNLADWIND